MAHFDLGTARRITAVSFVVLGLSTVFAQKLSSADPADKETAQLVTKMVPQYHLSRTKISDEISSQLLDSFIEDLDPQKLYFLASDIAEFETHRKTLDDELTQGNVDFAYHVFDVYRERLAKQMEVVHHWIDQPQDFSLEEYIETDGDKLSWSTTTDELDDRWRRRVKYDLLQFKLDNEEAVAEEKKDLPADPIADAKERLHKRYRTNKLMVDQYSTADQLEIYLTALTQCFDPHSSYMSPNSWEDFEIQMRLSLDGIGAALRGDDGYTVVAQIVPGGAASVQGELKVGDKIIGVGQEGSEIVDIFEMKLSEVVRLIRGPRGTKVQLQVKDEAGKTKVIAMVRQKIELKESEVKGEVIDTQTRTGRAGKIGLISLPSFYRDFAGAQSGNEFKSAAVDVAKILSQFARENIDAVIIDLRNNGGGALTEAIEVSGHFIDRGPVVQVKEPSGYVRALDDEESGVMYPGPLVVICNKLSASASEIFAGVIKDYHRGLIIGDTTTHGKGTVQNLMDVSPRQPFRLVRGADRGKLKLTIQQFYRVNGDSTQNLGVPSDVVIPSLIDNLDLGEASLDNALPFDKIRPAAYTAGQYINPEIVAALQKNSEARVDQNPDFQKVERAIQRYLAIKSRTRLPLNESAVKAERAENERAEKEDKPEDEELDPEAPIFPEGFYNDEILNITLDYIQARKGNLTVAK